MRFSVLDRDWQWLTAKCRLEGDQLSREHRFCGQVVDDNQAVVLPDTAADPDYRDNPMVMGAPYIRAYAGVPAFMHDEDGAESVIGTLCVVYHEPRAFSDDDLAQLHQLAAIAPALVSSRPAALELADLATARRNDLQRLTRMHRRLGQAERMAKIGSWRYDLNEERIHWSDHVYAIHDLPHGKEPGFEEATSFYPGQSRALLVDALVLAIEQGRP